MIERDVARLTIAAVENRGDLTGTTQAAARTLALIGTRLRANLKRNTHDLLLTVHDFGRAPRPVRLHPSTLARINSIDIERADRLLVADAADGLGQQRGHRKLADAR